MDVSSLALSDRDAACSAPRIPTARWPFFGTTLVQTILEDEVPRAEFIFEAERDTLFLDLSVRACSVNGEGDVSEVWTRVSIEYCNTDIAVQTSGAQWAYCCASKGPFLLGVRENKKLRIVVDVDPVVVGVDDVTVELSLNGFQGNGCCS